MSGRTTTLEEALLSERSADPDRQGCGGHCHMVADETPRAHPAFSDMRQRDLPSPPAEVVCIVNVEVSPEHIHS